MSRVAAIHYPLRHVDAGAGHVRPVVHIDNLIDRATIHPHAKLDFWPALQRFRDFQRTSHRRIDTRKKRERHAVARRQPHQFVRRFRRPELLRSPDDLIQLPEQFALLIDRQLGITNDVCEQDMRDLQLRIGFGLRWHVGRRTYRRVARATSKNQNDFPF